MSAICQLLLSLVLFMYCAAVFPISVSQSVPSSQVSFTLYKRVSPAELREFLRNWDTTKPLPFYRPYNPERPVMPIVHYEYSVRHPASKVPRQGTASSPTVPSIETSNIASYAQFPSRPGPKVVPGISFPKNGDPKPGSTDKRKLIRWNSLDPAYDSSPIFFPDSPQAQAQNSRASSTTTSTPAAIIRESTTTAPTTSISVVDSTPLEEEFINWVNSIQLTESTTGKVELGLTFRGGSSVSEQRSKAKVPRNCGRGQLGACGQQSRKSR